MKVGDFVRYNDLASLLRNDRGEVKEITHDPPAMGNIIVRWIPPAYSFLPAENRCRECDFNLAVIGETND